MKRIFIYLLMFIGMRFNANAQYSPENYVYQKTDKYKPVLCGLASYLLPGLGQIIEGETLRGLAFTGAYAASVSMVVYGANNLEFLGTQTNTSRNANTFLISGVVISNVISLWCIFDAVKLARLKNIAYRKKKQTSFNFNICPTFNTKSNNNLCFVAGLKYAF